jgi:cell division protease FtsH
MYGRSRTMVENLEERRIIARHEAGHAVVHFTCKRLPPLYQVSILPRNESLGSNMLLPKEDAHIPCPRWKIPLAPAIPSWAV